MSHYTFVGADGATLATLGWSNGANGGQIESNEANGNTIGIWMQSPDVLTFAGDGTFGGVLDLLGKGIRNWNIFIGAHTDVPVTVQALKFAYTIANGLDIKWATELGESLLLNIPNAGLALGLHTFSYNGLGSVTFDGTVIPGPGQTQAGQIFSMLLSPESAFIAGMVSADASPGAPPPNPPPYYPPIPDGGGGSAPGPFFGGASGGAGVSGAQGNDPQFAKYVQLINHRWKY